MGKNRVGRDSQRGREGDREKSERARRIGDDEDETRRSDNQDPRTLSTYGDDMVYQTEVERSACVP